MRARVARFTVAFQTLLLVGSLLVPALVAATEIATDLWIYQDGDTVTVTGIDFGAIEAVDVVTTDPEGTVVDSGTATTDDMGGFTYQFVLNVTVGGIYNVVATGQASGFTAATQFDPPVSVTTTTTLNPLGNVGVGGSVSLAGNLNWGTPALNNAVQSKNGRTIHLNTYASAACNGSGTLISNATTSGSSGADAASYAFSWTPASAGTYFVAAVFDGFTIGSGGDRDDYQASNSTATCRTVVVDGAPMVTSTTPANGATNVAVNANIVISFSEPVSSGPVLHTTSCTVSGYHTASYAVGPASTFTLTNITPAFATNETCTVTINAVSVTDQDSIDPPDAMAANYVFSFSTADAAPAVTSTTPANGATNVAVNSNIVVNFSESVSAGGAVSISCTSSGTHSGSLSASPSTSFTFNPTTDFVANETCTVTVDDNDVTDTDTQDPPNNMAADYLFSFSTPDGAPIVVSTNPASGATGVSQTPTIIVRFNEPVDLGSWYMLQCTSSGLHTGLIGGGPAIWSLSNITPQLSAAETCTFTVRAAEVTDQDANDPPDNLAADYVFQFQVLDIAPSVTTTTPLDDATDVALNASVVVTFSEPVTVDTSPSNWIDVTCNSVSQAGVTSGGGTTWTFDPTDDLPSSTTCSAQIKFQRVHDVDNVDPPDEMDNHYSFSFTTVDANTAPTVSVTGVSDGGSYEKGSVPAAGCSVVDAEDGNSTFAPTLGAITGPDAATGVGSQTASCWYTDDGGIPISASATYSITDGTGPEISYVLTPATPDGDNGWFLGPVTLDWTVNEGDSPSTLSLIGCVDQSLTDDQASTDYSCSAASAGGSAGPITVSIKIDGTAPVITDGGPTALANANGWYKVDVTNTFSVNADVSGPDAACEAAFPGGSQTKTTSGEGSALTVTSDGCTDMAGNAATGISSAAFEVDKTAPTAVSFGVSGLSEGGVYYFGFVPVGPASCTANYDISGSSGCVVSGYSTAVGSHTVQAAATDQAGNVGYAEIHYTVNAWTITGFYSPVDMGGVLNTVKAGSTVPLKFEIFAGPMELTSTAYIKGFAAKEVACGALMWFAADDIEITSTGGTQLRYDSTGGQFIQNWATPRNKANTCWAVTMTTNDGSSLNAYFKLK